MPASTRRRSRSVRTVRGIDVRTVRSSKRRMPWNTSRTTRNDQRSPRMSRARPMVQFSADQSSAGGLLMRPRYGFWVQLTNSAGVRKAESVMQTQTWLRPAGGAGDEALLAALLAGLSPASAFHRFMAGLGTPKPALVRALLRDAKDRGAWLALERTAAGTD